MMERSNATQTPRTPPRLPAPERRPACPTRRGAAPGRVLALLVALAGFALAAPGCAATQRKAEPLADSVRTYNDGVRWQRFDEAATRLPPDLRDEFLDQRDQLHEDLRVSDYEIIRVRNDGKGRRARVQIKYTWYLESSGKVHETHAVQTWHQGEEIWILRGERFLRGEPMPGLKGGEPKPDAPATDGPAPGQAGPEADPSPPAPDPTEIEPAPLEEEAADDPPQGS
jgi:hypothetical protein